jgi:transcriptional regulator with XRE-family HTH domain
MIFDQLNTKLQQEDVGSLPKHRQILLEELGRQLRQWRMREGCTRQQVAEYLHINVDYLSCIENGIGVAGDRGEPSLRLLLTLLAQDELDISLASLIRQYLASHEA